MYKMQLKSNKRYKYNCVKQSSQIQEYSKL